MRIRTLLAVFTSYHYLLHSTAEGQTFSPNVEDYKYQMEEAHNLSLTLNKALKEHDKKVRPNAGGPPVIVTVEFKIISIGEIREAKMEFSMDIFFRQWWKDPRLSHNSSKAFNMAGDATKMIWTPDTFFWNVKDAKYHYVTRPNMRLKIQSDGSVYFSTRITFTAQCDMDLRLYPMDIQKCPLIIESYAHTTADIDYKWKKSKTGGIEVVSKEMAQFEFIKTETFVKTQSNSKGAFASLRAIFTFKRRVSYFISATYMPAIILVVLSWCCFWIPRTAVPARITLSITTILTTILLYGSVNSSMPKVSYSKAIDYFLMTSLGIIFVSLLEFILVLNTNPVFFWFRRTSSLKAKLGNLYKKEERNDLIAMMDKVPATETVTATNGQTEHMLTTCRERLLRTVEDQKDAMEKEKEKEAKPEPAVSSHWIDRTARVLFPITYLVFCIYYWIYYGTRPNSAFQLF